jgi:hypothetical protein
VNDWIKGGILTFSDFSTVSVPALNNDGSATVITLPSPVLTSSIMLTVTSVGPSTSNVGLSEFSAYGQQCSSCAYYPLVTNMFFGILQNATDLEPNYATDLALWATATASSSESSVSTAIKINDGYVSGYPQDETEEWSSNGEGVGAWAQLNWTTPVTLRSLVIYDRINTNDWCTGSTITFDDGSFILVPALNNDGSPLTINLAVPVTTYALRFTVTAVSASTGNVGLAELSAYSSLYVRCLHPSVVFSDSYRSARLSLLQLPSVSAEHPFLLLRPPPLPHRAPQICQ